MKASLYYVSWNLPTFHITPALYLIPPEQWLLGMGHLDVQRVSVRALASGVTQIWVDTWPRQVISCVSWPVTYPPRVSYQPLLHRGLRAAPINKVSWWLKSMCVKSPKYRACTRNTLSSRKLFLADRDTVAHTSCRQSPSLVKAWNGRPQWRSAGSLTTPALRGHLLKLGNRNPGLTRPYETAACEWSLPKKRFRRKNCQQELEMYGTIADIFLAIGWSKWVVGQVLKAK